MSSRGVALVTGASRGIGRAIALRLADDGFDVAINSLPSSKDDLESLSQELVSKGRRTCIVAGDVSVELEVQNMVSTVVEKLGELNVMVANAGVDCQIDIVDSTMDHWERTFAVNTRGVFLCYKYAGIQMIKQGRGGRIIGAASAAAHKGFPGASIYTASKCAVVGLTQTAALEWGRHKITVNAYAPGLIKTPLLSRFTPPGTSTDEFFAMLDKDSLLGYIGTPVDVASLVSYLASKESHFITGQSLGVNGGLVLH